MKPQSHLWKFEELPPIQVGQRPKILLLGNGINRAFDGESWEDLIASAMIDNGCSIPYKDIQNMPATMQIVIASSKVYSDNENCQDISKFVQKLCKGWADNANKNPLDKDYLLMLEKVLGLPVDAILTTNYSNEFEIAATGNTSMYSLRCCQRRTKDLEYDRQFRLYQYSSLGENYPGKSLWHIHGDISKPDSVVLGHYYYGKLLRKIEDRVSDFTKHYHSCMSQNLEFVPKSWVDYFLLGDVYMLGFGMDLSEQDLWWLQACKQKNFPELKTFYYSDFMSIEPNIQRLLRAYGVEILTNVRRKNKDYKQYYKEAIEDLETRLKNK